MERVRRAAAILGVEATTDGGHTHAERQFAGLGLRVHAHSKADMAAYYALTSYSGSVQPGGGVS